MKTIEFEDEESLVAVTVGFALESLDLIVDAFELTGGDRVLEVIEDADGVSTQRLAQADHLYDPALQRLDAPGFQILSHPCLGRLAPEPAQFLLKVVGG